MARPRQAPAAVKARAVRQALDAAEPRPAKTAPAAAAAPAASSDEARRRMQRTRQRDTRPEMEIRSKLFRMGLRYRIDMRPLKGVRRKADIVFPSSRLAVYVDGCFWHGCPLHGTWPKANAEFWREKIEANRRRDEDTNRQLAEAGWVVLRIWEHEDLEVAAERISTALRSLQRKPTA